MPVVTFNNVAYTYKIDVCISSNITYNEWIKLGFSYFQSLSSNIKKTNKKSKIRNTKINKKISNKFNNWKIKF